MDYYYKFVLKQNNRVLIHLFIYQLLNPLKNRLIFFNLIINDVLKVLYIVIINVLKYNHSFYNIHFINRYTFKTFTFLLNGNFFIIKRR